VPLTADGQLNIVASADLGGLGAKDGSPITYNWVLPGVAPLLLPWLVILGLLTLKSNRCASAWLIWLPLGCVFVFLLAFPSILPSGTNFFLDAIMALAIGLAAVWLLSNRLRRQHRFVTFLCILPALAGFSLLAMLAKQCLNLRYIESMQTAITLAVAVAASSAAMSVTGWICRREFRPVFCGFWLLLTVVALWLLIALPFFLVAVVSSGGRIPWSEFLIPILIVGAANYAVLLPFLILSGTNAFYRERLKLLLNIQPPVPPPLEAGPGNIVEPTKP
jgi:hypothetical protein